MDGVNQSGRGLKANPPDSIIVSRPVYTHSEIQHEYDGLRKDDSSPILLRCIRCCGARRCFHCVLRTFPFVSNLAGYSLRKDLINDIIAGLTIGIMHIPQGMAYGMLASLGPVYGLYSSFFPVLVYFFFGTSNHISIGTSAVTTLMLAAASDKGIALLHDNYTTLPNAPGASHDTDAVFSIRLLLILAITFLSGAIQFVMGVSRLGFVATYLSDPLIGGFTTGAAFHVFASQLPHIFGLNNHRYSGPLKFFYILRDVFRDVPNGNPVTIVMALIAIIVMLIIKIVVNSRFQDRMKMPVPIELIVIIIATIVSYFAKFNERYSVIIVGSIPRGLPAPIVPGFSYLPGVIGDAISLAIVGFAVTISLAKLFAKKHNYEIDPNQELMAYGSANMFSSFFGCFFTSGALARSTVQESAGGRTQVAGLVSCALMLVALFAVGPLFYALPYCILGAIIVVNLRGMFAQFFQLCFLWRVCKYDFCIWLLTLLATVVLDIDWGLLAGVLFSLLTVLWRSRRTHCALLGCLRGSDVYRDLARYSAAEPIPGVRIFQFGSSLYYANADYFRSKAYEYIGVSPRRGRNRVCCAAPGTDRFLRRRYPVISNDPDLEERELTAAIRDKNEPRRVGFGKVTRYYESTLDTDTPLVDVILDCSMMGYLDKMGIDAITQVVTEYKDIGVTVYLAAPNDNVYDSLVTSGFFSRTSPNNVLVSVHDAVTKALSKRPSDPEHDEPSRPDTDVTSTHT